MRDFIKIPKLATEPDSLYTITTATKNMATATTFTTEKRHRSIFEVPGNFFDSCILLPSPHSFPPSTTETSKNSAPQTLDSDETQPEDENRSQNAVVSHRWTCNTCKAEFDSLQDQRSHFKSDIHRFNVIILTHLTFLLFSAFDFLFYEFANALFW